MLVTRAPCPALRPYVRQLWAVRPRPGAGAALQREHVLPTGDMHLAFRLGGPALRVFTGPADKQGAVLGHAVVGGARSSFHVRQAGGLGGSVGALLSPGSALGLLGAAADALAGRHTLLDDLWGSGAGLALDQLHEAPDPGLQLDVLENILLQRLGRVHALHPAVACALSQLQRGASIGATVRAAGLSHRRVLTLFRQATGLAPKQYASVLRLQSVLRAAGRPGSPGWAELSLQAGFSDQAHFSREFHVFAGMTPQAWRRAQAAHPNHVPVAAA